MPGSAFVAAVIPALDEEASIGAIIVELLQSGIDRVIVGDNGSVDRTAEVARAAGALVVPAPRRGYGSACLAALSALPPQTTAVVFCDADGADDLRRLPFIIGPILRDEADLVIGNRTLGRMEPGSMTLPQRCGNIVASALIRLLFGVRATDLGPFRCLSTVALSRIRMCDPAFGWTAEMQVKAYRLGLRVIDVPVDVKARKTGESKISGRIRPVLMAGWAIITTICRYRFCAISPPGSAEPGLHANGSTNQSPFHLWLFGGFVLVVTMALAAMLTSRPRLAHRAEAAAWVASRHPTVPRLTTEALTGLPAASYLLVDARPVAEWSVSHVPGAFRSEDADEVVAEAHRRHLDRVIVYCSIGERSSRLAEQGQARAQDVRFYNLVGGIFTWASENRPLEDADGQSTRLVHPYDASYGALLPPDRRAPVTGPAP
jgi:rhodanese-related sulfurtransferase/glycosyltransferase involved in cell wall biosynthesis